MNIALIILSFLALGPLEIRELTTDSTVSFGSADKIFNVFVNGANNEDGITYFTGENGCTADCTVPPNTNFNLFYGVQNVQGCTATNTSNNTNWQGGVPTGGGTGDFTKLIVGGITQTTTFNIDCPVVALSSFNYSLIATETIEINFPNNTIMRIVGLANKLLLLNIEEGNNTDSEVELKEVSPNIYFSNYRVDKKENLKVNLNYDENFIMNEDIRVWMLITEIDPRINRVDRAIESGLCDVLSSQPSLNITTNSIMVSDINNECVLSPGRKYFLSKVYLK